eukprot:Gb_32234 [translate_table: standard]
MRKERKILDACCISGICCQTDNEEFVACSSFKRIQLHNKDDVNACHVDRQMGNGKDILGLLPNLMSTRMQAARVHTAILEEVRQKPPARRPTRFPIVDVGEGIRSFWVPEMSVWGHRSALRIQTNLCADKMSFGQFRCVSGQFG